MDLYGFTLRRIVLIVAPLLAGSMLLAAGEPDATAEPVAPQAVAAADSAVTVTGRMGIFGDDFTGLTITVSQTKQLGNQAIKVSWSGGAPTVSSPSDESRIGTNYLQIMQCWGNPDDRVNDPLGLIFRETCQVGGYQDRGGTNNRRNLAHAPADLLETLPADAQMVPFQSWRSKVRTADGSASRPFPPQNCVDSQQCPGTDTSTLADYFNQYTTNEIFHARTFADGTGEVNFEAQTATESAHLGCGLPETAGSTVGKPCYLVIVPRGTRNGPVGQDGKAPEVVEFYTGPLGASTWQDRIVVPLEFSLIGQACPIESAQRRTVGSEFIAEAMASWQPALCATTDAVYGYSPLTDAETSRTLRAGSEAAAGLGFTTAPIISTGTDAKVLHAPVALSSAVIAFNIDAKLDASKPGVDMRLNGSRITDLRLRPLVVARLLTQYYKRDVPGGQQNSAETAHIRDNPRTLRQDPQFLADNPIFATFVDAAAVNGLTVTIGNSQLAREVWRWILADQEARDWLTGNAPAELGVINKYYASIFAGGNVPGNFPKNDPSAFQAPEASTPYLTTDMRPYATSLHATAVQALRADTKARIDWDPNILPAGNYKTEPVTPYGSRFSLVITDAASAQRYDLPTAQLRNRAGQFVASTPQTVLTALTAMAPSELPEVLAINPTATVAGAYPLPMLTYAAMDTTDSPEARADYADLVRFAVGAGQSPGRGAGALPPGYVPLPDELRAKAVAAATVVQQLVNASPTGQASQTARPTVAAPRPAASTAPVASASPSASRSAPPVAVARFTDAMALGWARYVIVGALGIGALGAVAGPLLRRRGRRNQPG